LVEESAEETEKAEDVGKMGNADQVNFADEGEFMASRENQ